MAELPLDQSIPRFKTNEDRFDRFVNGTNLETFMTSTGYHIPSVAKFMYDLNASVNTSIDGLLAQSEANKNAARDFAQAASQSASDAALFDPSSYYTREESVAKDGDSGLGGFTSAGHNLGPLAGTITPNPANGNFQYGSKNGATTLNAPPDGYYSLQIEMVNTASPGGLTIVGALVKGEFNPEAGKRHFVTFRVSGSTKVANIEEAN